MTRNESYWQQRVRRRRVLHTGALAGGGLAAAALVGCGSSSKPRPTASGQPVNAPSGPGAQPTGTGAAKQPKRGGSIARQNSLETMGYDFDPQTQTPLKGQIYRIFYQGLLGPNPVTYAIEPELAQKWEQPDQLTYLFHLQPGVKFHNKPPASGREMTIDDVVFSLNRARSKDPAFTSASLLDTLDKMEAADKLTLRLTTSTPDAPFLAKISGDQFMVLAPEVVQAAGKFSDAGTAVGTGAFMLSSREDGVSVEYVRNPNYWKPGLPYLDAVHIRHFGDPADDRAWTSFTSGQLDVAVAPGANAKDYLKQQGPGYTPLWNAEVATNLLQPNTKVKPFDDPRVTTALRLLTDHDEFKTAWAETWFGRGAHGSIFPGGLQPWDLSEDEYTKYPDWKQPKDDAVKQALSLLSAAGFTKDTPLKTEMFGASTPYAKGGCELLQAQFRRLGQGVVDMTLNIPDSLAFQRIRTNGSFTYGMFTNQAALAEPDSWLSQVYHTGGSRNYWHWGDPALDALIDKQRATFDTAQRKAVVRDVIIYAIQHAPGVLISERFFFNATKPKVRDFSPEFYMIGRQWEHVWLDT